MKQQGTTTPRLAALRAAGRRVTLGALVALSFALMLLGKADTVVVERLRTTITDALAPVLDLLSEPSATISDAIGNLRELADIRAENARLREENERLLRWELAVRTLETENTALRRLLNFIPGPTGSSISARVVADQSGAFAHGLLVLAGTADGVRKGQVVVTEAGLAGRVAAVGRKTATVMLMTDINFRVPVVIERTRTRAVVAGDNSDRPRLAFMPLDARVVPGDRIVTSGDAAVFPPGLPVGIVSSVADGQVRVQPFVDLHRLEYVRVVDYGLAGVLADAEQP